MRETKYFAKFPGGGGIPPEPPTGLRAHLSAYHTKKYTPYFPSKGVAISVTTSNVEGRFELNCKIIQKEVGTGKTEED